MLRASRATPLCATAAAVGQAGAYPSTARGVTNASAAGQSFAAAAASASSSRTCKQPASMRHQ